MELKLLIGAGRVKDPTRNRRPPSDGAVPPWLVLAKPSTPDIASWMCISAAEMSPSAKNDAYRERVAALLLYSLWAFAVRNEHVKKDHQKSNSHRLASVVMNFASGLTGIMSP